ncbi:MAG: response regulator [Methylicorpusculum sp.]|uniref:response regulator n=1 Tax=Methylicorpusculum sp. TaxID=2713644 RepID=UPI0027265778|nr:response regulator [Methylicorpusculum sp.]MDO8846289.1 response regulator [Methylicorpusculum sp.]MDO8940474.1 response regulator [Methylicorpusculum sp.]MDO9240993.1 response regulator [Methylicorpusculum sp.]MDP2178854.1 response regulator [Methylicorpusculum sp.]MDP2203212.1 response regulator [Methylicorpusculum sp.]
MIKVLLVDDHEIVRSGVESLLNGTGDICVIAVASSGEECLELLAVHQLDVVLMDISMPGIGGAEASRRVLLDFPAIKVIVLSVFNDGPVPQQLMKMGAAGFISKSSPFEEMVVAIRSVMKGERYLCSEVARNMAFWGLDPDDNSPFSRLSQRESEVVVMILNGKSIKEMSELLTLSDKTINTYRYRLYEKLHVKNDVELTRLAIKYNYTN